MKIKLIDGVSVPEGFKAVSGHGCTGCAFDNDNGANCSHPLRSLFGSVGCEYKNVIFMPSEYTLLEQSDGTTANYYVLPEGAEQLQDLISERDMNAQIGEIFRACYRYGKVEHSSKLRDINKILFYAQAEKERLQNNEA
jgi:hypothetical protein